MATFDKRNTTQNLYTGGTNVGLAVYLSAAEASDTDVYGAGATAGWYIFGTFDGGKISFAVESEKDKDEAGQLTGAVITTSETFVLENVIKETDDKTQTLIDKYLSQGPHKYRYPLPAGKDGTGAALHQVYGIQNGIVDKGWEMDTKPGKRMRAFKLEATAKGDVPAFVRATVKMSDQANWPAALAPFKDA